MNEIYELNFHGNRQEIETEKLKMRELMSHFPKALGTVDETKYVLQDDDKPKLADYFESNPISPLTPPAPTKNEPMPGIGGIGGLQSEKPKKDDNAQTMARGLANWGNKENTLGFGNGKDVAAFLSPQKETNETEVSKSPFDLGGNTAKEEKWSFDPGVQFQGFGAVTSSKPRTKTVKNDSLRLEKSNIENIADSLKTVNVNNNTNTVSNNVATTKPYVKPGLYGGKPKKDYSNELNKLKQDLPPIAASILENSGTKIVVLDNMFSVTEDGEIIKRAGRYFADKKKIYLDSKKTDDRYAFISEAIHAVQDYLGMTGLGKSNLEFQEHVIKDLYFKRQYIVDDKYENYQSYSISTDREYDDFITSLFDENKVLDLNKFLSNINHFMVHFQKKYEVSNSYQAPAINNFNYNWIKLLHIFGIGYKY